MIFVALNDAASRDELLLIDGGLCRFHRRRDGVTVIREILVLPKNRRHGVGRLLLAEVFSRANGGPIVAKCPRWYAANLFWSAMGFTLSGETERFFQWERRV